MELGKVPPNDIEAEQAVIGSMLTDKEAVIAAIEVLRADDFYREDNKAIYQAIMNLYNRSEPIDIITLKSELTQIGKFESVGGLEYITSLPEKVPTTANVEKYIKIVEEKLQDLYSFQLKECDPDVDELTEEETKNICKAYQMLLYFMEKQGKVSQSEKNKLVKDIDYAEQKFKEFGIPSPFEKIK